MNLCLVLGVDTDTVVWMAGDKETKEEDRPEYQMNPGEWRQDAGKKSWMVSPSKLASTMYLVTRLAQLSEGE